MGAARLSTAIAIALGMGAGAGGCYASHERDAAAALDAAGPLDAGAPGECSVDPGEIVGLECPASAALGAPITVELRARPLGCCEVTAPLGAPARDVGGGTWEVEAPFSVCRCCEGCSCDGVIGTRVATVGPATGPGVLRVIAGDLSCEVAIEPLRDCRPIEIDGYSGVGNVALGEPIPIRAYHDGGVSCGCRPTLRVISPPFGRELELAACECSDLDPCVDPGYEVTLLAPPSETAGRREFVDGVRPGGTVGVMVVDPARCIDDPAIVVEGLSFLAPDPGYIAADPHAAWVFVTMRANRCCGAQSPLFDVARAPSGELDLTFRDCAPDPCDCTPGEEVRVGTPVFLGTLPSGTTRVRLAGFTLDVVVP